ncbi:MAG: hypothetical protein OEL89_04615 [Candidatus Peregrinibacteria bacterium]|nr:hypothetical protein [Candidatus Peregrinibacteria bacterium]
MVHENGTEASCLPADERGNLKRRLKELKIGKARITSYEMFRSIKKPGLRKELNEIKQEIDDIKRTLEQKYPGIVSEIGTWIKVNVKDRISKVTGI